MAEVNFVKRQVSEIFGENCFNDSEMRTRLPKSIYKEFKRAQNGETELTLNMAEVIGATMRDWAVEKGATHYTHWFHPLTGCTAEKHDSFISPTKEGKVLLEFSGKELVQGEPDASSFPSGGLRSTFEARGYTAWDITSPAFVRGDETGVTLYIPTAFISYTGEALDKKVPLLRSMEALEKQALRVLRAMGNKSSKKVYTTVGPEQEYFLVDKEYYDKRPDLLMTGRTLFGAMPPKGQEMEAHYFGAIKERVEKFMKEFNYELWKIGVTASTQHNEVAPNQFELATIFKIANVATDNNQVVMDMLEKIASRHGLVALLHEKPFAGFNGSGKHNNWSMATDDGINLLEPGTNPQENIKFLISLSAVIKAVDKYANLLRVSAANPGNDHRLGANEAPPAIISIFLGDQLSDVLEKMASGQSIEKSQVEKLEIAYTSLPDLPKDFTDRNRTSPFAFTGNKFEFRMVASSDSISGPNVILNTAVAEVLDEFATRLENSENYKEEIAKIIIETYNSHKKVIFNGNGYGERWLAEAEKRGLPNLASTVDALPEVIKDYSIRLFEKYNVFTRAEVESRYNIYMEQYVEQIEIEARTMVEMADKIIFPAANEYLTKVAESVNALTAVSSELNTSAQRDLVKELSTFTNKLREKSKILSDKIAAVEEKGEVLEQAKECRKILLENMSEVREFADKLELIVDSRIWPLPTYEDLLFKL